MFWIPRVDRKTSNNFKMKIMETFKFVDAKLNLVDVRGYVYLGNICIRKRCKTKIRHLLTLSDVIWTDTH